VILPLETVIIPQSFVMMRINVLKTNVSLKLDALIQLLLVMTTLLVLMIPVSPIQDVFSLLLFAMMKMVALPMIVTLLKDVPTTQSLVMIVMPVL
jgi:hypothetical protein